MSLTAMAAPKPMRQPASTEKNGPPKPCPIGGILRLPTSNQSGQSYPATVWSDRIDTTCCHESEPFPTSWRRQQKTYTSLQASILVAPFAGAESMSEKSTERHARARDPHPGTRVPTSGKGMAAPRDASKTMGAGRKANDSKEKGVE